MSCVEGDDAKLHLFLRSMLFRFHFEHLKPWVKDDLRRYIASANLPSPAVSLHVRHSDKFLEVRCGPDEEYLTLGSDELGASQPLHG